MTRNTNSHGIYAYFIYLRGFAAHRDCLQNLVSPHSRRSTIRIRNQDSIKNFYGKIFEETEVNAHHIKYALRCVHV